MFTVFTDVLGLAAAQKVFEWIDRLPKIADEGSLRPGACAGHVQFIDVWNGTVWGHARDVVWGCVYSVRVDACTLRVCMHVMLCGHACDAVCGHARDVVCGSLCAHIFVFRHDNIGFEVIVSITALQLCCTYC